MFGVLRSIPRQATRQTCQAPRQALRLNTVKPAALPGPFVGRRYISVYGYTQAKALVYAKYGEPKDVLRFVAPQNEGYTHPL